MSEKMADIFTQTYTRAVETQKILDDLGVGKSSNQPTSQEQKALVFTSNEIYEALKALSEPLGKSYAQAKLDLADNTRISWAGTAHEIRQIVSSMLQLLAPDEDITSQRDYHQDPKTNGPTQKQRVTYILRKNKAGSKVEEVVQQIVHFDEMISDLVRGLYSRASDAAHRPKDKKEAARLMKYFEAFAPDLLNL